MADRMKIRRRRKRKFLGSLPFWKKSPTRHSRLGDGARGSFLQQKELKLRLLTWFSTGLLVALILGTLFTVFAFVVYSRDLPNPDKLTQREIELSTKIYDREGKLLYDIYGQRNRTLVKLEEVPGYLKQATIAIEDKDFYRHQGFAPRGILRALFNIVFRLRLQGGSTLTQQLIKNTLLTPERTLPRKIKEFMLAIQVEKKYSKDEILQMYLNESPYGGTAWGVGAASEVYFGKKVSELTLAECAVLAGLPQKPTAYSPFGPNPKAYKWRSVQVLRRIREDGYISPQLEEEAKRQIEEEKIEFSPSGESFKAPHFVMFVKGLLVEMYGERMVEQGGLQVTTTLDLELQEAAQKIVAEEVVKLKGAKVGNGAAIVTDPKTGEILAMVGSFNYFAQDYDGNVNVTLSERQPGSMMKPVVYAAAFKKGYTPATMIMDVQTEFPSGDPKKPIYIPKNYDGKYRGPTQVRYALGNSINLAAVKMAANVGIKDILTLGYQMGATTWEPIEDNLKQVGLSLPLGGREVRLYDAMVVFGTFANGGARKDLVAIKEVKDPKGKVLFGHKDLPGRKVLGEDTCFLISHILLDNEARKEVFGPQSYLNIQGKPISVKSGTTDEKKDNWAVGYTRKVVVGVWVGNNDNSPMDPVVASGATGASPIWRRIMLEATKEQEVEWPEKPENVDSLQVDVLSGMSPGPYTEGTRSEYFIKGTEPGEDSVNRMLKISKANGNLANETEIGRGDYEEKLFLVFEEEDPVSTDGKNRWQEGIDKWLAQFPDEKYHPPREVSGAYGKDTENVFVKIEQPANKGRVEYEFDIEATVLSPKEITKVEFKIDGETKKTTGSTPYSYHQVFGSEQKGKHKIRVEAQDSAGNTGSAEIEVSVGEDWSNSPSPTSTPTPTPTPTSTPTPTPTATPAPTPSPTVSPTSTP